MSEPLNIPPGVNINTVDVLESDLAPDMFYKDIAATLPPPDESLNDPIPRAWSEGGIIESVKRAVVNGVRAGLQNSTMWIAPEEDLRFHVDIEYPTQETQYPGVWVQFTIENLARAGLGMVTDTQDDQGNWIQIRQWMFDGRITLSIAALTSLSRDRLSDAVISQLAFSRPSDMVLRNPSVNTNEMRGLWTELMNNPYVSIVIGNDRIESSGQTVTNGVPWAPNILLYEDGYSITCHGQFNIAFRHDGVYELSAINVNTSVMDNAAMTPYPSWVMGPTNQIGLTH